MPVGKGERDDRKHERFKDVVRSDATERDKVKPLKVAKEDQDEVYTSQQDQIVRGKVNRNNRGGR